MRERLMGPSLRQAEAGCERIWRDCPRAYPRSVPCGPSQGSLEALARTYDELLVKHVQNGAQDGPQNQVNSSTAIEAEVMAAGDGRERKSSLACVHPPRFQGH